MNQKWLEIRKQGENLSVASRRTIEVLKEKETSEKKEEKGVKEENVVDAQYKTDINTA